MKQAFSIEEVKQEIQQTGVTLLFIGSETCSVCHSLLPQVEKVSSKYPSLSSVRVKAEDAREVAGEFSVLTVPVVLLFIEGKEVYRKARFVPIGELDGQIAKLISSV
ncbi:thioredoxin family protein [Thalassobacillus pellis]|uniref:thioredoxin family protein n=1 Tax=Thalassobacillus pellis TaxID=748008 RepID=UPI001962267F|nr:thioredoxin family protein [Thalassobacillus pellis]MBM7554366.1 thioredoxin-like negative regulator of GroEL [Thalassobacillus pellis]